MLVFLVIPEILNKRQNYTSANRKKNELRETEIKESKIMKYPINHEYRLSEWNNKWFYEINKCMGVFKDNLMIIDNIIVFRNFSLSCYKLSWPKRIRWTYLHSCIMWPSRCITYNGQPFNVVMLQKTRKRLWHQIDFQ